MDEKINFEKKFEEEFLKLEKEIKKPNILIAGATGTGKSSIVNKIFGSDTALVGSGKSVTKEIEVFEDENVDVRIYDTKGYEIKNGGDEEFFKNVVNLPSITGKVEDAVHLIWYCISCASGRVTEYDLNAINRFSESNIPVAVLLTKCDIASDEDVSEMTKIIKENFGDINIFEISVKEDELSHIDELIKWSVENLEKPLKLSFIKSQKKDLKEKWKKAHLLIAEHALLAFGVGFTPIPISDAPLLVANELGLLARILYLYDLSNVSDTIKQAGYGATITALLTASGKICVSSILKLIPGFGAVVGGLISGSVGSSITFAFGEATNAIAYQIEKANLNGNKEYAEELIGKMGSLILEKAKKFLKDGKNEEKDYSFEDID